MDEGHNYEGMLAVILKAARVDGATRENIEEWKDYARTLDVDKLLILHDIAEKRLEEIQDKERTSRAPGHDSAG